MVLSYHRSGFDAYAGQSQEWTSLVVGTKLKGRRFSQENTICVFEVNPSNSGELTIDNTTCTCFFFATTIESKLRQFRFVGRRTSNWRLTTCGDDVAVSSLGVELGTHGLDIPADRELICGPVAREAQLLPQGRDLCDTLALLIEDTSSTLLERHN